MNRIIRFHQVVLAVAGLLPGMLGWSAIPTSADGITRHATTLFRDANRFWSREFVSLGGRYRPPTFALFTQQISGVCDAHAALSGPFYCPPNQHVYLDRAFLEETVQLAKNAGDMALAYVIGHEVAHHVQYLVGTTALVEQARSRSTPAVSARTWVTEELQADCYAGLWVRSAVRRGGIGLAAEVPEALDAVTAMTHEWQNHLSAGQTMNDPFTYGTAAQRLKWFRRGLDGGDFNDCDTFNAEASGNL